MAFEIQDVHARQVLDSRGNPTVEVEVGLGSGVVARAAVPSGASTGENEAVELRDGDASRYLGKAVTKAVANVNDRIAPMVEGMDARKQEEIDRAHARHGRDAEQVGTGRPTRSSPCRWPSPRPRRRPAACRSTATSAARAPKVLPVPMFNILNGGKHADNNVDFQEFMIQPWGFDNFEDALRAGVEIYHTLKKVLHDKGLPPPSATRAASPPTSGPTKRPSRSSSRPSRRPATTGAGRSSSPSTPPPANCGTRPPSRASRGTASSRATSPASPPARR